MPTTIFRFGILLTLAAGVPAAAQPELFFAAGVDSTGWAQARSNADGHVLIESPQYPRGLWLHWVNDAGDALVGLQVEYQERPDSLVAIRCVDPVGAMREMLVWTRPEGNALRLTLKPKEGGDLPAGLASIDWQIDPSVESLLDLVEETRLVGGEAVAAFLRARWQDQAGRVAIQLDASASFAVELDRPEAIETLVAHLQQVLQSAEAALGAINPLKMQMQVFAGNLGLQEGVILRVSWFDDPNLERMVRAALGRPQGPFTPEDFAMLTELGAGGQDIRSLAGIEYFAALLMLALHRNQITDLTPLNQLKNLQLLELDINRIVDLTPLSQLKNLNSLGLYFNQITDLTPLNQLNSLQHLNLGDNRIVDLTPLNQLKNLQDLHLGDNQIVDLTPLNQLKNLNSLYLYDNQITDLTPLNQLNSLEWLYLGDNPLSDQALTEHIPALQARGVEVYY